MIDWSQFQDKDKVRIELEGVWEDGRLKVAEDRWTLSPSGTLRYAISAILVERPWTPPAAGKLFKRAGMLFVSLIEVLDI